MRLAKRAQTPEPAGVQAGTGGPVTLAIDVGGNGLKAALLSPAGELCSERVRVKTPRPAGPDLLVATLCELVRPLPAYHRVSVGFPGMVREGRVLTAPNLVRARRKGRSGKGKVSRRIAAASEPSASEASGQAAALDGIATAWSGHDLAAALAEALGRPTRVVNDASMQGAGAVSGEGLEWMITLGTGFGTALFWHGKLTPNLEFSQHPFQKGRTYDQRLGNDARVRIGNRRWSARVRDAVELLDRLSSFDRIYVGGGNSRHLKVDLGRRARLVDNTAGILGGVRIWDTD